jgi:hypothetical protein
MRQLLTEKEMYKLCNNTRLCSIVNEIYLDQNGNSEKIANQVLDNFIEQRIAPKRPDSHLIPGIEKGELKRRGIFSRLISGLKGYEINNDTVTFYEFVTLYPNPLYKDKCDQIFFGPMTSAITHCYDVENDSYAFQIRGKNMKAAGQIQIAAAGFGIYGEKLSDTAMRELTEELGEDIGKTARLVIPENRCLDIVPFVFSNKTGFYPQPLVSYVATADLSSLQKLDSIKQITNLREELKTGEVSDKFTISIDNLEKIGKEIETEIKFYGDMYRSIKSFLKWLYHS